MHLLVNVPPTVAISRLARSLNGVSSPQAAAGIPRPATVLPAGETAVVRSYFAGRAGGAPISVLRRYIEQQDPPDPAGGQSAITTGLKAGALADILVATWPL